MFLFLYDFFFSYNTAAINFVHSGFEIDIHYHTDLTDMRFFLEGRGSKCMNHVKNTQYTCAVARGVVDGTIWDGWDVRKHFFFFVWLFKNCEFNLNTFCLQDNQH